MRLFIAASIPSRIRTALRRIQDDLRRRSEKLKWVRPESMHLTLRFIGEVGEDRLSLLQQCLRTAFKEPDGPLELALSGIGLFPEKGRPRVLWARLVEIDTCPDGLKRLSQTRDRAENAIVRAGFEPDSHPLKPHLTLARFGRDGRVEGLREIMEKSREEKAIPFEIRQLGLIRSFLDSSGSRYKTLEEYSL